MSTNLEHSHSICFEQLMPVLLSEPISYESPSLPFRFTGGFSLSSKAIGFMLSVQGAYSFLVQIFIFPPAVRYFGPLRTFRFAALAWPVLYFIVPYLVLLPQRFQIPGVYVCLLLKMTFHVLAYPSNAILLANATPSLLVLGVINGVAASTASLARAFGPTLTGIIHSWGLEWGSSGVAWWASGIVCVIGAIESCWVEEVDGRMDEDDVEDEVRLTEETLIDPLAIGAAIDATVDLHGQSEESDGPSPKIRLEI